MNGTATSKLDPRTSAGVSTCRTCGATVRLSSGACIGCLLRTGLLLADGETLEFDAVLAELDLVPGV